MKGFVLGLALKQRRNRLLKYTHFLFITFQFWWFELRNRFPYCTQCLTDCTELN